MATSVVTATRVSDRNLPAPPHPVSRITAAVVLIAGATLQLVEELIEPPFATDSERFVWLAQHTTLHAVDVGIGLAAIPLLIAAVLLLARLAGRMPRLARTGAAVCVAGFCGLAAVHAELAMLDGGVSPATVEAAVAQCNLRSPSRSWQASWSRLALGCRCCLLPCGAREAFRAARS
jgi:hypothetical protein